MLSLPSVTVPRPAVSSVSVPSRKSVIVSSPIPKLSTKVSPSAPPERVIERAAAAGAAQGIDLVGLARLEGHGDPVHIAPRADRPGKTVARRDRIAGGHAIHRIPRLDHDRRNRIQIAKHRLPRRMSIRHKTLRNRTDITREVFCSFDVV